MFAHNFSNQGNLHLITDFIFRRNFKNNLAVIINLINFFDESTAQIFPQNHRKSRRCLRTFKNSFGQLYTTKSWVCR